MVLVLDIGYILVLPITVEESVERPLAEALLVRNKATNIPTLALDINLHIETGSRGDLGSGSLSSSARYTTLAEIDCS